MTHPRNTTTTVAILGTDALAEGILARLLQKEGYATTILEAHPAKVAEGLLEGVDLLLLAPRMKDGVREGFLEAMSTTPETSATPVLTLSDALKMALLDELSAGVPWRGLFEELVGQIGAALKGAAESAEALVAEC